MYKTGTNIQNSISSIRQLKYFWRLRFVLVAMFLLPVLDGRISSGQDFKSAALARPWESRPYLINVWLCTDNAPEIRQAQKNIETGVVERALLTDPSGWDLTVEPAPSPWRYRLLTSLEDSASLKGIEALESLKDYDKMIAVCLSSKGTQIDLRVRELDIQTQQWGAIITRTAGDAKNLDALVYNAIVKAFMPIARVENVTNGGVVTIKARAVNACLQTDPETNEVVPIEKSPAWIRPEDRFLPVIRRVDRNGVLAKLEPIEFTYLTIEEQAGPKVTAKIQSRARAPLSGRSSKRAQKLALVIRPPESPTILKLVAKDDTNKALEGYEVWSRLPGQPKEVESEFLGLTDWRGQLPIMPNDFGLRLIYVKRGSRALLKLPIIPGLLEEVVTRVPDDDARLNAEGVINGVRIEILSLVAERQIFESRIDQALKTKKLDEANQLLTDYTRLETPQKLKNRMADEESRLKGMTTNKRELTQITGMFQVLREILNSSVGSSQEPALRAKLQHAKKVQRGEIAAPASEE